MLFKTKAKTCPGPFDSGQGQNPFWIKKAKMEKIQVETGNIACFSW
jgi:hypothetical protein